MGYNSRTFSHRQCRFQPSMRMFYMGQKRTVICAPVFYGMGGGIWDSKYRKDGSWSGHLRRPPTATDLRGFLPVTWLPATACLCTESAMIPFLVSLRFVTKESWRLYIHCASIPVYEELLKIDGQDDPGRLSTIV